MPYYMQPVTTFIMVKNVVVSVISIANFHKTTSSTYIFINITEIPYQNVEVIFIMITRPC